MDLSSLTKQERGRLHSCLMKWSDLKRVAAGRCRHCGEGVPCWSAFGDYAPGKRHTARTYRQASK